MPTLNQIMEIDHVVYIGEDGEVDNNVAKHYSPEIYVHIDKDGLITDEAEAEMIGYVESQGWELLTGRSGQYSYSGPIMHASEYIGGALEDYMRSVPGYYVAVVIADGWAVAYRAY